MACTNDGGCVCGLNRTCRQNMSVWQGYVVKETTALKRVGGAASIAMRPRLYANVVNVAILINSIGHVFTYTLWLRSACQVCHT